MATFNVFKETALPGTLQANSIYYVTAANSDHVEMYVTNNDGTAVRRQLTEADVQILINNSLSAISALEVVADIAARDALTLSSNTMVLVKDATADPTVNSGAATYVWDQGLSDYDKISEFESLDLVLNWTDIVGGPTSTPSQIDTAVTQTHTHSNKTQLDNISEDANNHMTYNGDAVVLSKTIAW